MKVIIVSGGFDPIHSGHIAYFKSAKKHGDKLIVASIAINGLLKKRERPLCLLWKREWRLLKIFHVLMRL